MMKSVTLHWLAASLLCFALAACSKTETYSTSLALIIASDDLIVGEHVNQLEVDYEKPKLGKSKTQRLELSAPQTFPISLVPVVTMTPDEPEMKIRVRALLNGVLIVSRRVTVFLAKDQQAELKVQLDGSCAELVTTCDDEENTCINGKCVEVPSIDLRMPDPGPSGADSGADSRADSSTDSSADSRSPPPPDSAVPQETCKLDSECETGHCSDGVCCDMDCGGKCHACNLPGKSGRCSLVPANAADPRGLCKDITPCGTNGLCDSTGECAYHAKTDTCGAPESCTGATYTPQSFCDGSGQCASATPGTCPNSLTCGEGGRCKGSCSRDADCGFDTLYCDGMACKEKLQNGTACTGAGNVCKSGNCVNNVCCGVASCGTCKQCGANGACVPKAASTPDSSCMTQTRASCGTNGLCDGSGSCQKHACICENGVTPQMCYPSPRFQITGGEVLDWKTNLTWQRDGTTPSKPWAEAKTYCAATGFRLPTRVELLSIVDRTQATPPLIDTSVFMFPPNVQVTLRDFWTSEAADPGYAHYVDFQDGRSYAFGLITLGHRVFCVR